MGSIEPKLQKNPIQGHIKKIPLLYSKLHSLAFTFSVLLESASVCWPYTLSNAMCVSPLVLFFFNSGFWAQEERLCTVSIGGENQEILFAFMGEKKKSKLGVN